MTTTSNDCIGSSFDVFLRDDGLFEECEATAIKRVIAWQLQNYMETCHITKTAIAKRMGTSRSFVDKILDDKNTSITLSTILKISKTIGKPLRLEFVETETKCPA